MGRKYSRRKFLKEIAVNTSRDDIQKGERWRKSDERLPLFIYLVSVWIFLNNENVCMESLCS